MNQKDFLALADEMEKECGDWENSEGLSEQTLQELIAKVEAMDAKESENHDTKPEKGKHFRLKKRYILVLAAALILLMGIGVAGDRAWIADKEDLQRDTEVTTKVDNEEKENILLEEEAVYLEISEKLGIVPMWLGYKPAGMALDSYTIMESTGWAYVNYLYKEKIISIQMTKKTAEISGNVQWDGEYRKLEKIQSAYGLEDVIEAYCIDEKNQNYNANIIYGNGFYSISGVFDEKEFLDILNGIYFKKL